MDHVAIMNPRWKLIPSILAGRKTIESRWYVHKITPWQKIFAGETVYFKDAGKPVTAKAIVSKVIFEADLNETKIRHVLDAYGKAIDFSTEALTDISWALGKHYCILIFLEKPERIAKPFAIDKKGFGSAAAWLTVPSVESIKVPAAELLQQ